MCGHHVVWREGRGDIWLSGTRRTTTRVWYAALTAYEWTFALEPNSIRLVSGHSTHTHTPLSTGAESRAVLSATNLWLWLCRKFSISATRMEKSDAAVLELPLGPHTGWHSSRFVVYLPYPLPLTVVFCTICLPFGGHRSASVWPVLCILLTWLAVALRS